MPNRPGFVTEVDITTTGDSLSMTFDAPKIGATPKDYIARLRHMNGEPVPGSRKVVDVESRSVKYEDLEEGTYRVGVRARAERGKGRWLYWLVTLGADVEPLPAKHYMYFIRAGEETPDDAIGTPTRHVKLINGIWSRFDPVRVYISNDTWWHVNEVSLAEERFAAAKDAQEAWDEEHPGVNHPLLLHNVGMAAEAVQITKAKLIEAEAKAKAEAEAKYPPENLTQGDARWIERPRPFGTK